MGGGGLVIYSFGFILLGLDLDVREIGMRTIFNNNSNNNSNNIRRIYNLNVVWFCDT